MSVYNRAPTHGSEIIDMDEPSSSSGSLPAVGYRTELKTDDSDAELSSELPVGYESATSANSLHAPVAPNFGMALRRPHIAGAMNALRARTPTPLLARTTANRTALSAHRVRRPSPNYRRQMLLNHMLLLDAAEQDGHGEAYEELKRLIIFAGIFFLFIIIFVLLKFQVSLDDVFKWSPVVWLIGVIICGLLMNLFIQLKKFLKKRRAKRLQEQQDLLYSLHLPTSFPCLAPPPHTEACCRCGGGGLFASTSTLVAQQQQQQQQFNQQTRTRFNALLANANSDEPYLNSDEIAELLTNAPSSSTTSDAYIDQIEEVLLAEFGLLNTAAGGTYMPRLPTYEQVMRGAKTWLFSKSEDEENRAERHPPAYSPLIVMETHANAGNSEETTCSQRVDRHVNDNEQQLNHQMADTPPPAYDESVTIAESVRLMSPELAQLDAATSSLLPTSQLQQNRVSSISTDSAVSNIVYYKDYDDPQRSTQDTSYIYNNTVNTPSTSQSSRQIRRDDTCRRPLIDSSYDSNKLHNAPIVIPTPLSSAQP